MCNCNFTDCIPTNPKEYPIYQGGSIVLGAKILGVITTGATGVVTTLTASNFSGNGTYSYLTYSGSWSFTFSCTDDVWTLSVSFTPDPNTPPISNIYITDLSCSQAGSGTETTLTYTGTYNGENISVVQHYHEDEFDSRAKVYWTGLPQFSVVVEEALIEGAVKEPDQDVDYSKNLRLAGRVVDQNGQPLAGMSIEAWDKDLITKDDILGTDLTDQNGAFYMLVDEADHKFWIFDRNPDVYFKIFDNGKLVHSTKKQPLVNLKETKYHEIQLQASAVS